MLNPTPERTQLIPMVHIIRKFFFFPSLLSSPNLTEKYRAAAFSLFLSLSLSSLSLSISLCLYDMDEGNNNDTSSSSLEDPCNINVIPLEFFFKFRKEFEGFRLGLNLEFFNLQSNEYNAKVVLKPLSLNPMWKFIYEPVHGDIRLLSKKIPITNFLNLQVGIGHSVFHNTMVWKWKLSTCLGGDGVSQIRNKTTVGLFPGFDLRIGWRAEYVLPEIHGAIAAVLMLMLMSLAGTVDAGETEPAHPPSGYACIRDRCMRISPEMNNRKMKAEYVYNEDRWKIAFDQ